MWLKDLTKAGTVRAGGVAEDFGDVVHEVPDPGDRQVLEAGEEAEAAEADGHPEVNDVGLERCARRRAWRGC